MLMKIDSINLPHLHNSEHLGFVFEVRKHIVACTPEQIDIPQLFPAFNSAVDNEDESYKIVAKSVYTKQIDNLDVVRDTTLDGMSSYLKSFLNHFDPAKRAAAERINNMIAAFGKVKNKNYVAQSADVINMLQEFNGSLKNDVAIIGMTDWVKKLEFDNNAFMTVFDERHDEQRQKNELTRLRTCRIETDKAYMAIVKRINAGIEFNGKEKYADFVAILNVSIAYYSNIIATRKGRATAKKKKEAARNQAQNDDE